MQPQPPVWHLALQVKGEVKIVNNADKPLLLKHVMVKIACNGNTRQPIMVKAICPKNYYSSEYGPSSDKQALLTIPTTASSQNPVSEP